MKYAIKSVAPSVFRNLINLSFLWYIVLVLSTANHFSLWM